MDEMHSWKVRDGNEKDMKEILSLRGDAFGEMEKDKLDPRFWRWEFMEGPDGKALIYIVEDENKIIGHFADLPRRFLVQNEIVVGTYSVDLMVHHDYRREGIFSAMAKYGTQKVKQKNGLFMMGFPIRSESMLGLKKIGWREVGKLPVLVYPIRFSGILNRYLHFRPFSLLLGGAIRAFFLLPYGLRRRKNRMEVEVEEARSFDESFDDFWQKAASLYPIIGIRDRTYLTWRYLQHPTRTYTIYLARKNGQIRGYIVLRKVDLLSFNSEVIADLLALDEEALSALVEKGIQHSRQEGTDLLGFAVPHSHPYYRSLKKMGFFPSFKTFGFIIYPQADKNILFSPANWYVNWGDADVI